MCSAAAQDGLPNGAVFVTRFSGALSVTDGGEAARPAIDPDGLTGLALDLAHPGRPPGGQLLAGRPAHFAVNARQTGQVFGVALDDAPAANVYLTATAAFGLHRSTDNSAWAPGMWGEGGGPGAIYRLSAADGYKPTLFATVALDGRANTGAALGNIAYDRGHRQFYVSDLESGMIHRLSLADGADLGHWDHGVAARPDFLDAASGQRLSLPAVAFDPASAARIGDCPSGDFSADPSCWNLADFRRRVWGVGVRRDDATGDVRLYYALWSSQGFGDSSHAVAGEEARNSVWSVRIAADGAFDAASARREFLLPDFFHAPEDIARAGLSHPVSDIAFPAHGDQNVMLLAERGGLRNRGLDAEGAFAWAGESRVLAYALDADGAWRPTGRHDIGFDDRQDRGAPYLRANAGGGVTFATGYDADGALDPAAADAFVWATGDTLCTPADPCRDGANANVSGLQGFLTTATVEVAPEAALAPHPENGPAYAPDGPDASYFLDVDPPSDPAGLARNDATRIGDVEAIQSLPVVAELPDEAPWYGPWEGEWPWPLPGPDFEPVPGANAPELAVTKATPPVCDWGETCTFLLSVANNGPGDHVGPIHLVDTPDQFGTIPVASPGWTCIQPAMPGPIACRHDAVTLAAGESLPLALTLHMPLPAGPLPAWPTIRDNCGFIVWPGALAGPARDRAIEAALALNGYDPGPVDGALDPAAMAAIDLYRLDHGLPPGGPDDAFFTDLFPDSSAMAGDSVPANDFACAPFVLPGTDPLPHPSPAAGPDLALEKNLLSPVCEPGMTCDFAIRVSNAGGSAYHGLVEFTDAAQVAGLGPLPAAAIHAASPMLACVPDAGGRRCHRTDAAATDLPPGATVEYVVRLNAPVDAAGLTLENCGFIRWTDTATPAGDVNPANDFMCVATAVPVVAPAAAGPDLSLVKTIGACGVEDAERRYCQFALTVTNNGAEAFDGVIGASDDVPAEARLSGWSGPGDLRWDCAQPDGVGGDGLCASETPVHLAPGAAAELDVRLVFPPDIAAAGFENCAMIAWEAMAFPGGRDANPENERSCVAVPPEGVAAPATEPDAIDLAVTKSGPAGGCRPSGECEFTVTVANNGPGTYSGPMHISDFRPFRPGELAASEHATFVGVAPAEWRCGLQDDESGVNCLNPSVELAPATTLTLQVTWRLPAVDPGGSVSNCAWVTWPAGFDADEHQLIANAQWALSLRGYFDGAMDGLMSDRLRDAIRAYQTDNGLAATGEVDAALRGSLYGGSAALAGDASGDNDRGCAVTAVAGAASGSTLRVVKTGPASGVCARGDDCRFDARVTNLGPDTYRGPLMLQDLAPDGILLTGTSFFGSGIRGEYRSMGRSTFAVTEPMTLDPGMSRDYGINIRVPDTYAPGTMRNCAYALYPVERISNAGWAFVAEIQLSLLGYETGSFDAMVDAETQAGLRAFQRDNGLAETGNLDPATLAALFPDSMGNADGESAEGCVEVEVRGVLRESDLAPGGATQCVRGAECRLDVTIDNRGNAQFDGAAGLHGVLDPAIDVVRIEARTAGLSCRATGPGAYECTGTELSIKPGDAARFDVIAVVPRDFAANVITHTKDMIWPVAASKDRHPENDRHVSTITIVDPSGPPAVDLAIAKTADAATCVAGERCVFSVRVTNKGPGPFTGPIVIADAAKRKDIRLSAHEPSSWACSGANGTWQCSTGPLTLASGQSTDLSFSFGTVIGASGKLENCASLGGGGAPSTSAVQQALNDAGYAPGVADGVTGAKTRTAIRAWQRDHGLSQTGTVDEALVRALFGPGVAGDANTANDKACATATLVAASAPEPTVETTPTSEPEADQPVCPQGWKPVSAGESSRLVSQGWLLRKVQRGGVTLHCVQQGASPQGPECRQGWTEVNRDKAKALTAEGWQVEQESRGGKTVLCARRLPGPVCPGGWNEVERNRAKTLAGQGYEIDEITRNHQTILCARKRPEAAGPVCPSGWNEVTRAKAKALAGQGYDIREVARNDKTILCARKRTEATTGPVCPRGWTKVSNERAKVLRRDGWTIETVRKGKASVLCARKG